ncbi:unnamed protein product [Sympodiomycopsis kandeliae]
MAPSDQAHGHPPGSGAPGAMSHQPQQQQQQVTTAAVRMALANKPMSSHHHSLSTSPRSNPALSDPDYWPDRDGEDDVFSNPDTAELEARSDATGATSPDRAVSPIVGSPTTRTPGFLLARATDADDSGIKGPPEQDHDVTRGSVPVSLSHNSGHDAEHIQPAAALQDRSDNTPTPSTLNVHTHKDRPSSSASHHFAQADSPYQLPPANELPQDPEEASHISSLFVHPPAAPSTVGAHGSPTGSSIRIALSGGTTSAFGSPVASTSASAAGSPLSERAGFQWTGGFLPSSPASRTGARPATRPHSPDRQRTIMPTIADRSHRASASFASAIASPRSPSYDCAEATSGLGVGPASASGVTDANSGPLSADSSVPVRVGSRNVSGQRMSHAESTTSFASPGSSIFERDIEHRDARHVLSKSEAVDVAIPPVLDDAVEAIIESNETPLEIVEPISAASPAPAALSAMALTAHSMASPPASASPITEPSPPMSHTGAAMSASGEGLPPGSIAAQIAERLVPNRGGEENASTTLTDSKPKHRGAQSSSASSASSSMLSRAPAKGPSVGVQQVLEGSGVLNASSPTGVSHLREASSSPLANIGRGLPSSWLPNTPSRPPSQHLGTALPSLPLPNPFRSENSSSFRHSPSTSLSGPSDLQAPAAPVSMSLDGAVIPSAESAIRELSLDGMADALASSSSNEIGVDEHAESEMPSPILPRKQASEAAGSIPTSSAKASMTTLPGSPSPYPSPLGRRDTDATITAASKGNELLKGANAMTEVDETIPGGLPADHSTAAQSAVPPHVSETAFSSPRRLSFFSYADIINQTPAEVIDLESSIQKKAAEDASTSVKGAAQHQAGSGAISSAAQQRTPEFRSKRIVGSGSVDSASVNRSASAGPVSPSHS